MIPQDKVALVTGSASELVEQPRSPSLRVQKSCSPAAERETTAMIRDGRRFVCAIGCIE